MKLGFKLFPHEYPLAERLQEIADFIEVYIPFSDSYKKFRNIDVPITIHAPHQEDGFNPGNKKIENKNKKLLMNAIDAADYLSSERIVVHGGIEVREESSNDALEFLKRIGDDRMLIENLILEKNTTYLFARPEDMALALEKTGFGLCLDFNHARLTSQFLGEDYKLFIKKFRKFKPKYFHVSDGKMDVAKDMHMHLGDGNVDLGFYKKMIPKNGRVVFETGYGASRTFDRHRKELLLFRSL